MALRRCYSSDMFPERERFDAFREEFALLIMKADVTQPRDAGNFSVQHEMVAGHGVDLVRARYSPLRIIHSEELLKDNADTLTLVFQIHGGYACQQGDISTVRSPGDAFIVSPDFASVHWSDNGGENLLLCVSKTRVASTLGKGGPIRPTLLARDMPLTRTFFAYAKSYFDAASEANDPNFDRTFGDHVVDLLALALGPSAEAREAIEIGGAKAARLHAIISEIAKYACEPGFCPEQVARKLGVTDRYVRLLLEETGKTFSERRLERRLDRAFRLLTDPTLAHRSVTDIALMVGFNAMSHFNRSFRRRFGDTPTGARTNGRP